MVLVVHVPHASTHIPEDVIAQFQLSGRALEDEARTSADLHTDLLAQVIWPTATIVAAPVSRIVVDVERYADDEHEVMAQRGRGMVYSHSHDGTRMRCGLSDDERHRLKDTWYNPHWDRLRRAAAGAMLIDLHSYPVDPWSVELNQDGERPEIDLGTDPALTPASWIMALQDHIQAHGYTVGLNTPYAGVIDAGAAAAIMIEIRRDIVGDPSGCEKWLRLGACLSSMPFPAEQIIP